MGILMKNERNYTGATGSGSTTPTNLNGLTDVNIASPTDGQALRYNNTSAQWENADNDLGGLSNVNISSPTNNQVLKYNSTSQKWENGAGGGGSSSQTYSTSEQAVGTWITGATVYEKTFSGTTSSSSATTTVGSIGSSSSVIEMKGACSYDSAYSTRSCETIPFYGSDASYWIDAYTENGTIIFNMGTNMRNRKYHLIVRYIK